jgi:hypothetical protein
MKTDFTRAQIKALLLVASTSKRQAANPYADLLATAIDAATPVTELTRIKDQAKAFLEHAEDRRHREAATLLYHAAVAAAFVHHAARISGRPMRKQEALYRQFADAWDGRPLGRIFREAAARAVAPDADT